MGVIIAILIMLAGSDGAGKASANTAAQAPII